MQTAAGTETVDHARDAFERIGRAVEDVSNRVDQIAASAQDLARTADDLNVLGNQFRLAA